MTEAVHGDARLQAKTQEIAATLQFYGVPLQKWGIGKAKTIRHLAEEILGGETALVNVNEGLRRSVSLVRVDIRYQRTDGVELQLIEDRQEFADGRVRRRGLTGVSEKLQLGENALETAQRGLRDELGIAGYYELDVLGSVDEELESKSYPGLVTEYSVSKFRTHLRDEDFKPEGYEESQPDKTTYFVWQEVSAKQNLK